MWENFSLYIFKHKLLRFSLEKRGVGGHIHKKNQISRIWPELFACKNRRIIKSLEMHSKGYWCTAYIPKLMKSILRRKREPWGILSKGWETEKRRHWYLAHKRTLQSPFLAFIIGKYLDMMVHVHGVHQCGKWKSLVISSTQNIVCISDFTTRSWRSVTWHNMNLKKTYHFTSFFPWAS